MKLATIQDFQAEHDRLDAEHEAAWDWLNANMFTATAEDMDKAFASTSELLGQLQHMQAVLAYWLPIATNEAERSPLLESAGVP